MKTLNISFPPQYFFPSKYFTVVILIALYLIAFQNPIYGQSNMKKKESCGYLSMENARLGAEVSKCASLSNSIEADQRTNSATGHGFNILGDVFLFNKKVALTSGCGFRQNKISISQSNFLASQKSSGSFDGIKGDDGSYINDERMYFSVPVRAKWRSGLIGRNKKMFIGSGINYYKLLSQDATLAFENNGVMTDQGKIVEVGAQNQMLDFETQVGVELLVSSNLILHAGVTYSKGLMSPYEESNLLLNNLGIQTGVYF